MEDKNNKINQCLKDTSKYFQNLTPRDPKRIDTITTKLNELWHKSPDLRFGQIIELLKNTEKLPNDSFYVEDDKWLNCIEKLLNKKDD